jgi:hypothetical protein
MSPQQPQQVVNRRHLYADESTESFFRRLSWTTDGAFFDYTGSLWQPVRGQLLPVVFYHNDVAVRHVHVLPGSWDLTNPIEYWLDWKGT